MNTVDMVLKQFWEGFKARDTEELEKIGSDPQAIANFNTLRLANLATFIGVLVDTVASQDRRLDLSRGIAENHQTMLTLTVKMLENQQERIGSLEGYVETLLAQVKQQGEDLAKLTGVQP